jgi:hypothetical protein
MGKLKMKNTYKIIGHSETCGDKFFRIAITNQEGETHTDIFSEVTLIEFARRIKGNFEVDEENEELVNELSQLTYVEIAEEEDSETGKWVFDIYIHKFNVDEDILELDGEGEYIKTFKTEKGAKNFAKKYK